MTDRSNGNISNLRMKMQLLSGTAISTGSELVSWFGAIQGQEYAFSKWSIGLRIPALKETDIEQDLNKGSILRTHLLRATWHIVHADDLRWILQLTAPRIDSNNAVMYRRLELDKFVFNKTNEILETILDKQQLTRQEISDALERNKIAATGMRLIYILMKAEIDGIICSGARLGKHFTYASLKDRAPKAGIREADEALAMLTRKYFRSRGPATVYDFATWSGLTISSCRRGIDFIRNELELNLMNSRDYYHMATGESNGTAEGPFLLPVYDEFIMGYKDRSAMFSLLNENRNRGELFFNNMILYKGQVIGTWKRSPVKNRMEFEFNLLIKVNRNVKQKLISEAKRFADFYGLTATLLQPL
ncbi:MAG TPA: winged helix DNA-binding domain-containing protein [Bacteroidales bacterium]|jgi:hypothetical protein|nr:winged helix DNA-binding domain-containing protein [Bacteroidales bacterium]